MPNWNLTTAAAFLVSTLPLFADSASIEIGLRKVGDLKNVAAVFHPASVNNEGKIWIDLQEEGKEPRFVAFVPNLDFDPQSGQILFRKPGETLVCGTATRKNEELSRHGADGNYFDQYNVRLTGRCVVRTNFIEGRDTSSGEPVDIASVTLDVYSAPARLAQAR